MEQRRVRLGDILDDYCPRERRITNHAVVAMIEEAIKQTRCTTCDAEHEYKEARLPVQRRRKPEGVLVARPAIVPVAEHAPPAALDADADYDAAVDVDGMDVQALEQGIETESLDAMPRVLADDIASTEAQPLAAGGVEDEWPVHRPLIRATLPRPEGHTPERKEPDFTMRAPGRFDGRNGQRHGRGGQRGRQAQGQFGGGGQFGGNQRRGGGFQGERNGNRPPGPQGRGGRNGPHRGPRTAGQGPGQGRGPKRGR